MESTTNEILASLARSEEIADALRSCRSGVEDLVRENSLLRSEIAALDEEAGLFAHRCVQAEAQNEALANLYVACCQLHASLDPNAVLEAIAEIVVGLVGAAEWAVFAREEETGDFVLAAGEGVDDRFPRRRFRAGEGIEGAAAESCTPIVGIAGSDLEQPAVLPLVVGGECVGLVGLYRMLSQKKGGFTHLDHELLNLLSGQAATALAGSRHYASRVRPM